MRGHVTLSSAAAGRRRFDIQVLLSYLLIKVPPHELGMNNMLAQVQLNDLWSDTQLTFTSETKIENPSTKWPTEIRGVTINLESALVMTDEMARMKGRPFPCSSVVLCSERNAAWVFPTHLYSIDKVLSEKIKVQWEEQFGKEVKAGSLAEKVAGLRLCDSHKYEYTLQEYFDICAGYHFSADMAAHVMNWALHQLKTGSVIHNPAEILVLADGALRLVTDVKKKTYSLKRRLLSLYLLGHSLLAQLLGVHSEPLADFLEEVSILHRNTPSDETACFYQLASHPLIALAPEAFPLPAKSNIYQWGKTTYSTASSSPEKPSAFVEAPLPRECSIRPTPLVKSLLYYDAYTDQFCDAMSHKPVLKERIAIESASRNVYHFVPDEAVTGEVGMWFDTSLTDDFKKLTFQKAQQLLAPDRKEPSSSGTTQH